DARIRRFDVVGHISHLSVALPDGRILALEAHVDKYPPVAFPVDALVALADFAGKQAARDIVRRIFAAIRAEPAGDGVHVD
ncbi:hypothetical protein AB9F46_35880, partial [Rhizobium leguminosarum]